MVLHTISSSLAKSSTKVITCSNQQGHTNSWLWFCKHPVPHRAFSCYSASSEKVLKWILTPDVQWPMLLPRQYTLSKRVKHTAAVSVYQTLQTSKLFTSVYCSTMCNSTHVAVYRSSVHHNNIAKPAMQHSAWAAYKQASVPAEVAKQSLEQAGVEGRKGLHYFQLLPQLMSCWYSSL